MVLVSTSPLKYLAQNQTQADKSNSPTDTMHLLKHTQTCTRKHTHTHTQIRAHTHKYTNTHTSHNVTHTCALTHIPCTEAHTYKYTYTHSTHNVTHIPAHIYHTHAQTQMYITHIHTRTHAHTSNWPRIRLSRSLMTDNRSQQLSVVLLVI